jgi:hypothetical protein
MQNPSGPALTPTPSTDYVAHKGVIETVEMNIWHLKLVLERLARPNRCPRLEWCFIPLGIFLTIWYGFVTTDFHDTFSIPKATWQALALILLALAAFFAVTMFLWWIGDQIKHWFFRPKRTTDELVDEIVAKMAEEKRQLEETQAAAISKAKQDAQSTSGTSSSSSSKA